MHLRPTARLLPLLIPLAVIVLISGCGGSDTVVVPETSFDEYVYGQDETLEIVTWNLENFAKQDQTTVDYLVRLIEASDVDVIALQEIQDLTWFRRLTDGLDGWSGYRGTGAYDDLNLAYIYKTAVVGSSPYFTQILDDEYALPRAPLVMEFEFDGVPVVVINNHYKCCGDNIIDEGNYRDEETRRRNASLLLESYCDAVYADAKVILVGDLNDELTDAPASNVFANFLDDPEHWRFADLDIAEDETALWSYPGYPSHIDHVLVNEHMIDDLEAAGTEVMVLPLYEALGGMKQYDDNISDHLPVMLRFVPTPAGTSGGTPNPFDGTLLGGDDSLEIVTWNLQDFAKAGDATVSYVARAVEAMQPDIVALQEIEDATRFEALVAAADGWSGTRANSAAYGVNLAFLYRSATVSVDAVYEILTDEDALPRAPYVLECTFGGKPLTVINNHFKASGDGVIDETDEWDEEWRRLRSSRLLQDWVETNAPDERVVILGDLNDELDDAAANNVFQDFLDDGAGWRFTDLAIALDGGALWSYPTWPSHLDHILITSELFAAADAAGAATWVVPLHDYLASWDIYDDMISDHLPVVFRCTP